MKQKISSSRISLLVFAICLMFNASASEKKEGVATDFVVSGAIVETRVNIHISNPHGVQATLFDTMSGNLSGTGVVNIYSSEPDGENQHNVISARIWHLADGQLFTSEVGENLGGATTVHSTVTGGTGIYKGATGTLTLLGVHFPDRVEFSYSGTLVLLK